jgi:hypothetical protein
VAVFLLTNGLVDGLVDVQSTPAEQRVILECVQFGFRFQGIILCEGVILLFWGSFFGVGILQMLCEGDILLGGTMFRLLCVHACACVCLCVTSMLGVRHIVHELHACHDPVHAVTEWKTFILILVDDTMSAIPFCFNCYMDRPVLEKESLV